MQIESLEIHPLQPLLWQILHNISIFAQESGFLWLRPAFQ